MIDIVGQSIESPTAGRAIPWPSSAFLAVVRNHASALRKGTRQAPPKLLNFR